MSASWQQAESIILTALDLAAEYTALGVELAGEPKPDGWQSCRAVGRDDQHPSAAVNVRTGRYRDLGGNGLSLSLWDFACQFGPFATWQEARKHFADKAGVKLPRGRPPVDPAAHLRWMPWNPALVGLWCQRKPGVSVEAVQAAGGRLARYREQFTVVALPIIGAAGAEADPVGWVICQTTGQPLPVFAKGQKAPARHVKIKTTAGSGAGMIGLSALRRLAVGPPEAGGLIWKTEGPLDMLALWTAIPEGLRNRHLVVANAGGATENPKPWMGALFAGWPVVTIPDADEPGQAGGRKWAEWFAGVAAGSKLVQLPYPIAPDHGKDFRDWLNEGHDYGELIELAKVAEKVKAAVAAVGPQVIEADDDPHRLARLYVAKYCTHADGPTLIWRLEQWWQWTGQRYEVVSESVLRGRLSGAIKQEFDILNLAEQQVGADGEGPPECRKVTVAIVANVRAALAGMRAAATEIEDRGWLW